MAPSYFKLNSPYSQDLDSQLDLIKIQKEKIGSTSLDTNPKDKILDQPQLILSQKNKIVSNFQDPTIQKSIDIWILPTPGQE